MYFLPLSFWILGSLIFLNSLAKLMSVDWSPKDPVFTGCWTVVVSAANGATSVTISSVVIFGVEVANVTCLGWSVVLSQLMVVLVTALPLSVFTMPGKKLKTSFFNWPSCSPLGAVAVSIGSDFGFGLGSVDFRFHSSSSALRASYWVRCSSCWLWNLDSVDLSASLILRSYSDFILVRPYFNRPS